MADNYWEQGADIEGSAGKYGDLVFLGSDRRPWWIVEWQPQNGMAFVIVNCDGDIATALPDELTRDFRNAGRGTA